jgi:predicted nucleic acid-binding protein
VDEIAVINASPLILLSRSQNLVLLREFAKRILVPASVAEEIAARGKGDITVRAIAQSSWIEVAPTVPVPEEIASWGLGPGESSVLAIAMANAGMTAVIDDLGGRKCAASLDIPVRGTLGIVLTAKRRGVIERARPVLEDLIASGLYLHRHVLDEALRRVGE